MKITPYDPKYKNDFIEMNLAWIKAMFAVEPLDVQELENIDAAVERGGQIFFAFDDEGDDDKPLACCMIAPRDDGDWEIMKFAARGMRSGKGAGGACLKACVDYAKEKNVPKIIVVSNRKCESAVHLYRKFGFREVRVDKKKFPFDRADIAFEMTLSQNRPSTV